MPRSIDCDYCGDGIEPGTGTMFVRINGQTVHFCSSKCEKNADLGREARDLEWTEAGRTTRGRAAARDSAPDEPDAGQADTDVEDQNQAVDDGDADPDADVEPDADEAADDADATAEDEDVDEETEEAEA